MMCWGVLTTAKTPRPLEQIHMLMRGPCLNTSQKIPRETSDTLHIQHGQTLRCDSLMEGRERERCSTAQVMRRSRDDTYYL